MRIFNNNKQWLVALYLVASVPLIASCDDVTVESSDVDIGDIIVPPPTPPAPLPDVQTPSPALVSMGDVNGDGVKDIAVVIDDAVGGTLNSTVKDLNGNVIQTIPFNGEFRLHSVLALPDMNNDGSMELAVFGQRLDGAIRVEIRNPLNAALIRNIWYSKDNTLLFTTTVGDLNGDGYPEITALFRGPQPFGFLFGQIKDPRTGDVVDNVFFDSNFPPVDFISLPDINGSGTPELVLLGRNSAGDYRSLVLDAGARQYLNSTAYGNQYTVSQIAMVPDMNSNGIEELAVLRQEDSITVQINDAYTGDRIQVVRFNPQFIAIKLAVLPDFSGNGQPEVAVLGINPTTGDVKAEVHDAMSGELLTNVWLNRDYPSRDLITIPDVNGNGSDELVALGMRPSDGKLQALIKDPQTNELLGIVGFKEQP